MHKYILFYSWFEFFFPQFYVYKPTRTWDMENWFGKKYEIIHKLWYAPLYFLGLVFLKGQEDV